MTRRDPETVRPALEAWLRRHRGEDLRVTALERPANGASSDTLIMTVEAPGRPAETEVVRIAPAFQFYMDAELEREWRVLQALQSQPAPPTPAVGPFEPDPAVLGAPFFVMERVPGWVLSTAVSYNAEGVLAEAPPARREAIWRAALAAACQVGKADLRSVSFLSPAGEPDGLAELLDYWSRYVAWASPTKVPILEAALDWLHANLPASRRTELAWGDARMGNIIFQGDRCAALIDWETPSLAGAEADLGWWLLFDAYDSEMAGLPRLPGLGDEAATLAAWADYAGRPAQDVHYHKAFAGLRLAAILQRGRTVFPERDAASEARYEAVMGWLARRLAEARG